MSCRAFARRIEYQCVKALFEHLGTDSIAFDYVPTDRNGPLTKLLTEFGAGKPPEANFSLQRDAFLAACPKLFHQVHTEG
jgi:predicted enzyme involved in methoxymalonyl-ACP biosynthesis